jgi:hypothetical protein
VYCEGQWATGLPTWKTFFLLILYCCGKITNSQIVAFWDSKYNLTTKLIPYFFNEFEDSYTIKLSKSKILNFSRSEWQKRARNYVWLYCWHKISISIMHTRKSERPKEKLYSPLTKTIKFVTEFFLPIVYSTTTLIIKQLIHFFTV